MTLEKEGNEIEECWDCAVCGEPLLKEDETDIHEWCMEFGS